MACYIPCKATLASKGLSGPPWGVPASVGVKTSPSSTPALPPCLNDTSHRREGVEPFQENRLIDVVEAIGNVGIEHIFRLFDDDIVNGSNGIMN